VRHPGQDPDLLLDQLLGRGLRRRGAVTLLGDHEVHRVVAEPAIAAVEVELEPVCDLVAERAVGTAPRDDHADPECLAGLFPGVLRRTTGTRGQHWRQRAGDTEPADQPERLAPIELRQRWLLTPGRVDRR
jgi:hypothetical protein